MWIRTKDGVFYLHKIYGVSFASWVVSKDKEKATVVPKEDSKEWLELIASMSSLDLELVEVDYKL